MKIEPDICRNIAQMVERLTFNQRGTGSSPVVPVTVTRLCGLFLLIGGDGKLSKRDEFGLNPRQRAFADEYIINKGNAYQAAIKAGYSGKYAKNADQFLLENSGISAYLKTRTIPILEKRWKRGDEVLEEIAKLAFREKQVTIFKKIDNQSGEVVEDVTIERVPKDEDSLKALELLGKYHKLFTDKVEAEVSGTVVFANETDIPD